LGIDPRAISNDNSRNGTVGFDSGDALRDWYVCDGGVHCSSACVAACFGCADHRLAGGTNLNKNAPKLGATGVLARYGNFYHGDDDYFIHCLILDNRECWLLGQGLQQVHVHTFKANAEEFGELKAALSSIPAAWCRSRTDRGLHQLALTGQERTFAICPPIALRFAVIRTAGLSVTLLSRLSNGLASSQ
jgi:hypothetical protein